MAHVRITLSKARRTSDQIERWCDSRDMQSIYLQPYSDDLQSIANYFGKYAERYDLHKITGAIVVTGEADYLHIWVSWDSKPYLLNARYQKISFRIIP